MKNLVLPKQHHLPTQNYFLSLNIHDLDLKKKFKSLVIITSLTYWNFSLHHRGILLMVYKVMWTVASLRATQEIDCGLEIDCLWSLLLNLFYLCSVHIRLGFLNDFSANQNFSEDVENSGLCVQSIGRKAKDKGSETSGTLEILKCSPRVISRHLHRVS